MCTYRIHSLKTLIAVSFIAALLIPAAHGQTARLEGIVRDPTQAVIPGVSITVTNEGTNISSTTISNETGHYVFVTLPPGSYTLSSELQGFKRYINKGIVLKVGDTATINVALETGEITSEVVVSAAAPLIDVTSGKIGSVVQERQVIDLPLNGRNPMMLFYLQAGTNPRDAAGSSQQAVGSVDGLRTNANNTKVEGVWAMDSSFDMSPAAPNVAVPAEAVGEYRVTTSSASAESGRGAGAQVAVVYRSGTNSFHGSVYEFNRNTVYNANNFFSNRAVPYMARPVFLRNQYGASLGGPIRKNKTFFFVTWEGQRQIQGSVENRTVYTQALRNGTFRFNTAKANSTADIDKSGNPVVPFGTIDLLKVDSTRLGFDPSGVVAGKLKVIPLPNNYDVGDGFNLGGYTYTSSNPNNGNQAVVKIDHMVSRNNNLTISLGGYWFDSAGSYMLSGYRNYTSEDKKKNIMIGLVSALRPNLTNEFHAGAYKRYANTWYQDPATFDHKGNFQLTGLGTGRGASPNGNPVGVALPQRNPADSFNIADSIAWVKRNHTIKVGAEIIRSTKNDWFGGDEYIPAIYTDNQYNPATVPSLTGLNSSDRSRAQQLINDLTGTIGNINQTIVLNSIALGFVPFDTRHRLGNGREMGMFFQDTWKAASNLTINLGLRWDIQPPGWFKNGIMSYPKGGSQAVLGISGPLGPTVYALPPDKGRGIRNTDMNDFGPHIGFTWDPTKNGKMSVSAYYRIAYDRYMLAVLSRLDDMQEGLQVNRQLIPLTRVSDPNLYSSVGGKAPIMPIAAPTPFAPIANLRMGRVYAFDENLKTPYTQSWSLRIQRELVKDWFVQASYVGNISVGGWRAMNYNQIEIRKNGFLNDFLAAQRNLAANGNPNKGEAIGVLGKLFAPLGGIPSSLNTAISQGQAAYIANYADTNPAGTGTRGGLVAAAGLPLTFFRANPQFENANIGDNMSVSTWHGMKLEVGKRFSAGTYFQFAYTLGKGLTDYVGGQTLYADFRDNLNRKLDKTLQNYDSTHIMATNGIWELPFGANKRWLSGMKSWQNALLGGWQLNGIFQLATSRPFSVTSGRYNLVMGQDSTPSYSGSDFNLGAKIVKIGDLIYSLTPDDKKLFTMPTTAGSAGSVPFRAFRGPLLTNIDASMSKNFALPFLGEQGNLQFRAEAFNLLNHTNYSLPTSSLSSGSFGQISSAFSARVLQFALRMAF
jgi:hypothetical protein